MNNEFGCVPPDADAVRADADTAADAADTAADAGGCDGGGGGGGGEIETLRRRAEAAEAALAERVYSDALGRGLSEVCFSSDAARRGVISRIREAGLDVVDGELPGLPALLDELRRTDPGAFADRAGARFTEPISSGCPADERERIMAIRDRGERRAAIAANLSLFR